MHIWCLSKWEKNIPDKVRTGLRLRFDKSVDFEVKRACKEFAKWLRTEYYFPIRLPIYIKNRKKIKALDGEYVYGTFFRPYEYNVEPSIRVAAGDYSDKEKKWGKDSALIAILHTISHEITHYYQWINDIKLTQIGEERQASRYASYILDEYFETRERP